MNIPNLLTLLRILLIPVLVVAFYLPVSWSAEMAAGIFLVAALTDWLDGYTARQFQQSTPFGEIFDPVADKLIVAVALVLLVESNPSAWLALPAIVIIGREIVVSALREWMAELGRRAKVTVTPMAKFKTVLQMLSITLLLFADNAADRRELPFGVGMVALYAATALTLWSMFRYLQAAWADLGPAGVEQERAPLEP